MRFVGLLLVALLVVPVAADPGLTLWGGRGGAALPDGEVVGHRQFEAAADWVNTEPDSTLPLRVNYGIAPRTDIGGLFSFSDNADVWGANVKHGLRLFGDAAQPAVGFRFVHVDDFDADGWQAYAVYTHNFGDIGILDSVRGSIGVNFTSIDFLPIDDSDIRAYLILEASKRPWSFGAEIQSESDDIGDVDPLTSFWARYHYGDRITFQGGFTNSAPGGLLGMDDMELFIGASAQLGSP